jgi:hypothetical protein
VAPTIDGGSTDAMPDGETGAPDAASADAEPTGPTIADASEDTSTADSTTEDALPIDGSGEAAANADADSAPVEDGAIEDGSAGAGADADADSSSAVACVAFEAGAGPCNALSPCTPVTDTVLIGGGPAAAAGGTIVSGTYVLTSYTVYGVSTPPTGGIIASTLAVDASSGTIQAATISSPFAGAAFAYDSYAATFSVSGTSLVVTDSCPDTATVTIPYTATSTQLMFASGAPVAPPPRDGGRPGSGATGTWPPVTPLSTIANPTNLAVYTLQ